MELIGTRDPFEGPRAKLARAKEHADQLDRAHAAFMEKSPYSAAFDYDRETEEHILRAVIHRQPPVPLALIFGDAIHAIRSALDHLAWRLVQIGEQPLRKKGRDILFPILPCRADFDRDLPRRLPGVGGMIVKIIERVQPYNHPPIDRHPLFQVNRLDVRDKHHLIIHVAPFATSSVIVLAEPLAEGKEAPLMKLRGGGMVGPLETGAELVAFSFVDPEPRPKVKPIVHFETLIYPGPESQAAIRPMEFLNGAIAFVDSLIGAIDGFITKTPV